MLTKCLSKGKLHIDVSVWSIWHERIQTVTQCHLVGIVSRWSMTSMSQSNISRWSQVKVVNVMTSMRQHNVSKWSQVEVVNVISSMSQHNVSGWSQVEVANVMTSMRQSNVSRWSQHLLQVSVNSANRLIYKCVINMHASVTESVVNAHLAAYHASARIPICLKMPCK